MVLKPQDRFGLKHIAHANRVELQEKQAAILLQVSTSDVVVVVVSCCLQNWWRLLRMERKNRVTTQDYLDFSAVCTRFIPLRCCTRLTTVQAQAREGESQDSGEIVDGPDVG